eukprot:794523-Karenia_brevis.AAC.1
MCADIFTKAFHQIEKWTEVRMLVNIVEEHELDTVLDMTSASENDKPASVWNDICGKCQVDACDE